MSTRYTFYVLYYTYQTVLNIDYWFAITRYLESFILET